jgi:5-methylcytosine-specific restriction endonuclease McrA
MKKTNAICPQCGDEFWYYPSGYNAGPKMFCSRKCWSASTWLIKDCPTCGKEFKRRRSEPSECCSYSCAMRMKYQGRRVTFACDQCGKELNKMLSAYRPHAKNHFCSRGCYGAWLSQQPDKKPPSNSIHPRKRIQRTCRECGKEFEITPSALLYKGYGTFCSRECTGRWRAKRGLTPRLPILRGTQNHNWKGGYKKYYGPNWREQRRATRKRDKYICQLCGVTECDLGQELHVHHITPFREFDSYQDANCLDNLISLCKPCHTLLEPRAHTQRRRRTIELMALF